MVHMITVPDFRGGVPPVLLHDLPARAALLWPENFALSHEGRRCSYPELQAAIDSWAQALGGQGLVRGARVAIFMDKQVDTVAASFAVSAAQGVLVPVNPLLKPAQVAHILRDCGVWLLVTDRSRCRALQPEFLACPDLRHVVVCGGSHQTEPVAGSWPADGPQLHESGAWRAQWSAFPVTGERALESDVAAVFYTSGSTGLPKGVVLSHRNLLAGAASVVSYLRNNSDDVLLAVLPLTFDAGFSQLTTAFSVGARVVLHNYLLPRDVLLTMAAERVTGLTAVPPLYAQLLGVPWPAGAAEPLRYWANTGGRMPGVVLKGLRERVPAAQPFLMYGLTEAFRSTYLPPEEVERRPDSIGKAIPNAEVLVLREDGSVCADDEPGELVHRGPLVSLGYWNRPQETASRFRPLSTGRSGIAPGVLGPELAVFSGDQVRRDAEGFLYFVGRRDEMIKTSGYRVSPTEVEEVALSSGWVREAVALGVPHEALGSAIRLVAWADPAVWPGRDAASQDLQSHFRRHVPGYMVPHEMIWTDGPLPRTPNGKLDRRFWSNDERL
jgi:acyl-CoA ligase (AMP-forming) (exosortase A-associated)